MSIRLFQIIIPILAVLFILSSASKIKRDTSSFGLILPGILFWLGASLLAIFPDIISNRIAALFGIKSNINAILFFCIGLLFWIQYNQFIEIRKLKKELTIFTRKEALDNSDET